MSHAEVAALDEIERPGHHPQVDTLLGRAALDVADVALQRHDEPLPRALGIERGEDRGVRDEAQRRAMRGPRVVVVDGLARGVGPVLVAEPLEQTPQLVVGEQVEQHDRVGLLGQLVAVGIVSLGAQDPVEPLDVAVLRPVGVPVELRELLVALELADDAVVVERHEHLAAHLLPAGDLVVGEPELGRTAPRGGSRGGGRAPCWAVSADPRHHDVRVGVVAQPALGRVRVLLVELVRAHDAVDLVPVAVGVEVRDRGPEARDLEHHLGAVVAQEVEVVGGLVVAARCCRRSPR